MKKVYLCPDCGSDDTWQSGEYDDWDGDIEDPPEAKMVCNQCGREFWQGEASVLWIVEDTDEK